MDYSATVCNPASTHQVESKTQSTRWEPCCR